MSWQEDSTWAVRFPPASAAALAGVEGRLGVDLPDSCRSLYLTVTNGGMLSKQWVQSHGGWRLIKRVLEVGLLPDSPRDMLRHGFVKIASGVEYDWFVLRCSDGSVYYWQAPPDGRFRPNTLEYVSGSIRETIESTVDHAPH